MDQFAKQKLDLSSADLKDSLEECKSLWKTKEESEKWVKIIRKIGSFDDKRLMLTIVENDLVKLPALKKVRDAALKAAKEKNSSFVCTCMVILMSLPGGKDQVIHYDIPLDIAKCDKGYFASGLVALQEETYINRRRQNNQVVKEKVEPGEQGLMRADCAHGGVKFQKQNFRVHLEYGFKGHERQNDDLQYAGDVLCPHEDCIMVLKLDQYDRHVRECIHHPQRGKFNQLYRERARERKREKRLLKKRSKKTLFTCPPVSTNVLQQDIVPQQNLFNNYHLQPPGLYGANLEQAVLPIQAQPYLEQAFVYSSQNKPVPPYGLSQLQWYQPIQHAYPFQQHLAVPVVQNNPFQQDQLPIMHQPMLLEHAVPPIQQQPNCNQACPSQHQHLR